MLKDTRYQDHSDHDGRFRLEGLTLGSYRLLVTHSSFKPYEIHVEAVAPKAADECVELKVVLVPEEPARRSRFAFGAGASVAYFDEPQIEEVAIDADGVLRAAGTRRHRIRPALIAAYFSPFSRGAEGSWEWGVMILASPSIGGSSIDVKNAGIGFLISAHRPGPAVAGSGWANGLAFGIAWSVESDLRVLRDDFRVGHAVRELGNGNYPIPAFKKTTGHSLALVLVYSFGKQR